MLTEVKKVSIFCFIFPVSVKEDKDSKGVIRFYLEGFDPKDHTANASVTDK